MQANISSPLGAEIAQATQQSIAQLAKQINRDYQDQDMKEERRKINAWEWQNDLDFTILGVIELYTSDICGYASQIAYKGRVQNPREAEGRLRQILFFSKPYFVKWYFDPNNEYVKVKQYVHTLNYLRLSALEYVSSYQNGSEGAPTYGS